MRLLQQLTLSLIGVFRIATPGAATPADSFPTRHTRRGATAGASNPQHKHHHNWRFPDCKPRFRIFANPRAWVVVSRESHKSGARVWQDSLARWRVPQRGFGSPSPGQRPRCCTQVVAATGRLVRPGAVVSELNAPRPPHIRHLLACPAGAVVTMLCAAAACSSLTTAPAGQARRWRGGACPCGGPVTTAPAGRARRWPSV